MADKRAAHVHKFKRLTYKSGSSIFFCALPDCNKKINTSLALGKRSICWRCDEPFIMNEYSLRLAKPHCEACHKIKDNIKTLNDGPVDLIETMNSLTLADRLSQTIKSMNIEEEDEL